jgi:hypothetical protein
MTFITDLDIGEVIEKALVYHHRNDPGVCRLDLETMELVSGNRSDSPIWSADVDLYEMDALDLYEMLFVEVPPDHLYENIQSSLDVSISEILRASRASSRLAQLLEDLPAQEDLQDNVIECLECQSRGTLDFDSIERVLRDMLEEVE